jgi:peptidoglycan/LPS O-acetylase OafA/YrhL
LLLIAVCVGLVGSAWLELRSDLYAILGHRTITGFLCAALIYLSAGFSNKWVRGVLAWRPLVALGVVSYSFYVWQQLFTGRSGLPPWCSTWPTNVMCIAAAGMLSYFLIERPFMRIKERGGLKTVGRAEKHPVEPVILAVSGPECVVGASH